MIKESVSPRDGSVSDLTFVNRVIRAFQTETTTWMRRGVGRVLIEELVRAAGTIPGKPGRLDQDQLRLIEEIARDLMKDAPDRATELEVALKAYPSWHNPPA